MNNFTFHNPVKLIFGKGQLANLPEELPNYGKKVLLFMVAVVLKETDFMMKSCQFLTTIRLGSP